MPVPTYDFTGQVALVTGAGFGMGAVVARAFAEARAAALLDLGVPPFQSLQRQERPMVAGLVLAAGGGRRFGMPKALFRHDGQLLVDRSIGVLRAARCAPVVVVLGAAADDVRVHATLDEVVAVDNPDWATGMGSSLRAGLAALADTDAAAAVVILVDMLGVTTAAVRRVAAGAGRASLVMAGYANGPVRPSGATRARPLGGRGGFGRR